jgi:GalNAc-alpha-(1->4)-GalNAc-alpha-(1->3)-diNAcBac-PP-undecaprenol alpha-1,4-N-acetyl-D-galactosaminyltransferase
VTPFNALGVADPDARSGEVESTPALDRGEESSGRAETVGRITTVIGSLGSGGAERNLLRLSAALSGRGYRVTLVTTDPAVEDFYEVPASVLRVRAHPDAHLSCRWFDVRGQARRRAALRSCLLQTRPDLVISFLDTVNVAVLLALWRERVPVIVSERIDPRFHSVGLRWAVLRGLTYPRASRVVLQTADVLPWARRQWPRWKAESIPNPVVLRRPAAASPVRASASRTVISLGRLQPQKGFDLLVRAFAAVAGEFPRWDLTIVGEGPEQPALHQLAGTLGVAERVHLTGVVKDPATVLAGGDLFVFASRYEGFPNALAEAMSIGMPVISFDCPSGPRELIRHDVDGLLVPPQDVGALAHAMRRLMADDRERARLAARAPEVVERFDAEAIFDRWKRLAEDVLREAA